ncbi:hypothetical protein LCGC14_0918910 [marine sediment metagenome]|uniref:Macro domain-containing protein n=1 Tax=marine sediment metagenome TaxID=412755 RepID=A0A0F9NRK3_9ZZZZ
MKEATGDIWGMRREGVCVCITTNGTVKSNGSAVMGRGVAAQAVREVQGIEKRIGEALRHQGNHLYMMGDYCTFPVKHDWWNTANLQLIECSAKELAELAIQYPQMSFILPRPGCGNGGLRWEDVKPIIEPILPDNVTVVTL